MNLTSVLYYFKREFDAFKMKTLHPFERLKEDMLDIKSVLAKKK